MKLFLSSHSAWLAPPFCAVSALYFAEGPFAVITTAMLGIVAVGGTAVGRRGVGPSGTRSGAPSPRVEDAS